MSTDSTSQLSNTLNICIIQNIVVFFAAVRFKSPAPNSKRSSNEFIQDNFII